MTFGFTLSDGRLLRAGHGHRGLGLAQLGHRGAGAKVEVGKCVRSGNELEQRDSGWWGGEDGEAERRERSN